MSAPHQRAIYDNYAIADSNSGGMISTVIQKLDSQEIEQEPEETIQPARQDAYIID